MRLLSCWQARGLVMAVSMAKELGVTRMAMPTNGNAGAALAAYCTRCGIESYAFAPDDTPECNIREMDIQGAKARALQALLPLLFVGRLSERIETSERASRNERADKQQDQRASDRKSGRTSEQTCERAVSKGPRVVVVSVAHPVFVLPLSPAPTTPTLRTMNRER